MSLIVFIIDYLSELFSSFMNKTDSSCVILYYHTVYPEEINEFRKQMDELLRWTRPIHINAIGQIKRAGRYSAVTFDDGFLCIRDNALPVLAERNIPATLFVPSGCLGERPPWLYKETECCKDVVMTAAQLNSLDKKLVLIGSHCRTHRNLLQIGHGEAKKEIIQSKKELEDRLNTPIETISFPHGDFNQTHIDLAFQAGYSQAFSIFPELNNYDKFVKGRVKVDPSDWLIEYRLKLLGAYRWLPKAFLTKKIINSLFKSTNH
jgi:peptidoglycan/xylan/chitin deacetylase (PgdA/CDA1 family)